MAVRRSTPDALLLLAVAFVAASTFCSMAADAGAQAEMDSICRSMPFPTLCSATATKSTLEHNKVDALMMLKMQVEVFAKRTAAARAHVSAVRATMTPNAIPALDLCDTLYSDVEDTLGAARRAIGFKDAVTIRAMMGMAAQDMKNCDERFRQVGASNPMTQFDQTLLDISENCRTLSNMI